MCCSEDVPNTCPIEMSCSEELEIMKGFLELEDSIS